MKNRNESKIVKSIEYICKTLFKFVKSKTKIYKNVSSVKKKKD